MEFKNGYYKPEEIDIVLDNFKNVEVVGTNKRYLDLVCAFDIETSNFYEHGQKRAIMYVWQFGIEGHCIVGRTWEEFETMMNRIIKRLKVKRNRRLFIGIHNLAYEFQFLQKRFIWKKVFAIKPRTPIYALTNSGLEFRCTYLLSGYNLAKLAENLHEHKIKKLTGELDYRISRNSKTPLTENELAYCLNDIKIVMAYLDEKRIHDGDLSKVLLTKTGYAREFCRNSCFYTDGIKKKYDKKFFEYRRIMQGLQITLEEYEQLRRGFQGGFTHGNSYFVPFEINGKRHERIEEYVTGLDFTSAYPFDMIAELFPFGKAELITNLTDKVFWESLKTHCCIFDCEFENIESTFFFEHYISVSKCWLREGVTEENGRLVSASRIRITLTEQDYFIIRKTYKWDEKKFKVYNFRRFKKAYLPKDFILAILKLYNDKTKLKGVKGKEVEYLNIKELFNACYGMIVTNILREENEFTDHWLEGEERKKKTREQQESEVIKYNRSWNRFLYYPWGVW